MLFTLDLRFDCNDHCNFRMSELLETSLDQRFLARKTGDTNHTAPVEQKLKSEINIRDLFIIFLEQMERAKHVRVIIKTQIYLCR